MELDATVDLPKRTAEDTERERTQKNMANQDCMESGGAGALRAEHTALELFQLASLLVGEPQSAARLVEETVTSMEMDPCAAQPGMEQAAREKLAAHALLWMQQRDPESFAVTAESEPVTSCVETDDMEASGITSERLAQLLSGAQRQELRTWLDGLPLAARAIFVQRAVLGRDNRATAEAMQAAGQGWTPDAVSLTFRSALCSLANQLAHSAASATA